MKEMVKMAMDALEINGGEFPFMTIPEIRDPEYKFSEDILKMVDEAGCRLEWKETMPRCFAVAQESVTGCWHILPKEA